MIKIRLLYAVIKRYKMHKTIIMILLLSIYYFSYGQTKTDSDSLIYNRIPRKMLNFNGNRFPAFTAIGITGGISNFRSPNLELGIGINFWETRPWNTILTKPFSGFSISANYNPYNKNLYGENINVWINGIIVLGINQNYYTNSEHKSWGIKPFIGVEIYGFCLIYGYNFFINKNEIKELPKHNFSIRFFQPVVRLYW